MEDLKSDYLEVVELICKHEEWRLKCLNLIPSENVTSPQVRKVLSSDLGHRYSFNEPVEVSGERILSNFYCGTRYIDEIVEIGEKAACELFDSGFSDLRPLSGHMSDMVPLIAFCKPGDIVFAISPENGGYPGFQAGNLPETLSLKVSYLPFREEENVIDVEAAAKKIEAEKPRLVIISSSFPTFPQPVKEIKEVCMENDSLIIYDASHVLGLIAGGRFQQPLVEGADLMVGSTHKSFFGPQGGLILGHERYREEVKEAIPFKLVDNPHFNRIAALTLAMFEMKVYGKSYAGQVIRNSKALGKALWEQGVKVRFVEKEFTESHMIQMNEPNHLSIALKLEKANIIVDKAGRLGVNEVTRRGMREGEMEKIASLIRNVLKGGNIQEIKGEVEKLTSEFREVGYCFDLDK